MSRPNPYPRPARQRPAPPRGASEESPSPPLPTPRVKSRPVPNLPSWPPPSSSSPPGPALPPRVEDRPPAPVPSPTPLSTSPQPYQVSGSVVTSFKAREHPPPRSPTVNSPSPVPARVPTSSPAMSSSQGEGGGAVAFGKCLHQAHDAINKRHEDELHALESFRAHVFYRAKADREYAQELGKINARANRALSSIAHNSPVVQAWKSYLEMCGSVQRMLSDGAVIMSGSLLSTIDQLYKDKKGAKKVFDSDRARMEKEFLASSTEVLTLRREYQRHLKTTETYRRKLEAAAVAKDQDKYRRKFVTQANHLHNTHNEYSLSILNVNAHQEHWQGSLLPFCLDTLQQRMELQISQWKEALSQYAHATDITQVYQDSFSQFYECMKLVDKEEEYVQFIQDNKQEQPGIDLYEFDAVLLSEYCSPSVAAGKVVMNNLTHTASKTRLEALERELEQHERDIASKNEELMTVKNEPDSIAPSSPSPGVAELPKHVKVAKLSGEIKELESFVARKIGQAHIIQEAAEELGDRNPPLFDALGEGVDVKDLEASVQTTAGAGTGAKHTVGGKMQATLFRGMKGLKGIGNKLKKKKKDPDSSSMGYSRAEFPGIQSVTEEEEEAPDSDEDVESLYDEPPEIPVDDEEWYYGDIDRRLAESKCKNPGDYLVRYSARAQKYVLTCNNNGAAKHFMIQQINGEDGNPKYRFESKAFPRISSLLKDHVENGTAVTRASGAILIRAITKYDKWSLRHNDVKVGRKIGKGAFGEVFEASLSSTGQRVAVKTCRSNELQDMDKFLQEAEILKQYSHPNIVCLIGVCAEKDPVYIVMELMLGGALLEYLRKKGGHQPQHKLCTMAIDACAGMEYLEKNNCIHRDLAARNCLVGENDTVKIADFGMSREDEGGIYIVQSGTRNIPIKWTAPEGLNFGKYTSASDVWSYGILLWEVFSCGSAPYPGMNNQEARTQVEMGYRMGPPADCPSGVHAAMSQCWQYEPEERPNFSQILDMLRKVQENIQ